MKYLLYCRKSTEAEDRQIMSIESQRNELRRAFSARESLEIVEIIEESKSAKAPGRPLFDQMVQRIECGEAEGILAWAPDRLARNSIDGGRLIYLLDTGILKDLKFSTYTFENNSQGKFMLSIMFGQSKYYSDALSENVKRGLRTKLEKGWRPARPPFGYLTDAKTRETVLDPERARLVKRMFELVLGGHSPKQVALIARNEWGLSMAWNRKSRGKPISLAAVYRILHNPFYAGVVVWKGQASPGRHQALVSSAQFASVRERMGRPGREKPQKKQFAFTGLIRCACGLMVTAESRTKPSGRIYTYYHCTKRMLGPRCQEPAVREEALVGQLTAFVASVSLPAELEEIVEAALQQEQSNDEDLEQAKRASRSTRAVAVEHELREVTDLRIKRLIDDEEFTRERGRLLLEQSDLAPAATTPDDRNRFELARTVVSFSNQAVDCFRRADPHTQREMIKILGSNPVLSNKKLSIQAAKPFRFIATIRSNLSGRRECNDVRTEMRSKRVGKQIATQTLVWANDNPEAARELAIELHAFRQLNEDDAQIAA